MFEMLKKRLEEEKAQKEAAARFYIENGYCETWTEENKRKSDNGIERESTATRWKQYKNGDINREKAVELATKRALKDIEKRHLRDLSRLQGAAEAEEAKTIAITVEWRKSATWGYNPTATATINGKSYLSCTGTASGCGYDKLTAAVANALNQLVSIRKMLYTAKEKALCENYPPLEQLERNGIFINYGAGYGVLPYFEGGVGMASFYGVFEKCGYKCTVYNETRTTNFYYFEKVQTEAGQNENIV